MFDILVRLGDRLAGFVDALDPDRVAGADAAELWAALDRVERLAAAGKTLLARRVAQVHKPDRDGARSAAEALARQGGTTVGAARDAVDTSTRLPDLPKVEAAVRRGELSPAQAALVSGAAAADPRAEQRLLDLAGSASLPELREECARVKAAADPDPEATNQRLHRMRRLRRYTDLEGGWNLIARGTPQGGAAFNAMLDPIIDEVFRAARREGRQEPSEAYAFDALLELANRASGGTGDREAPDHGHTRTGTDRTGPEQPSGQPAGDRPGDHRAGPTGATADDLAADLADDLADDLAAGSTGRAPTTADSTAHGADSAGTAGSAPVTGDMALAGGRGGAPGGGPGPAVPGRRHHWNPRFLALLRVDLEALRRGMVAGDELCEITGVGPVPAQVARRLLGDAVLKLVITRGVDVCNVTHLGRGPTTAQKIALAWTSPTCTVEGCHRRRVEYDHREDYARTRHTRLDELDPLCEYHHDLKTRHGWALLAGTGKRATVPPDDPRHPRHERTGTGRAGPDSGQAPPERPTAPP